MTDKYFTKLNLRCHLKAPENYSKQLKAALHEENVYKLSQDVIGKHPNEIHNCYVVFISNPSRTIPLWRQRAGKDEDKLVIWDYHVIFLYHPEPEKCLVYDLDSELPFPTYVHKYITETFRTDHILKPDYFRYFRVVAATEFLKEFASDRRHMKRSDGTWIKPPPNYSAIKTTASDHNLEDYIQMDTSKRARSGIKLDTVCAEVL
ncbi:hypothetical protein NQ317_010269 [Molorchus minor]|uniref:Protein N-terminal glutamine amidohydrolase n=1 Tax=Molorchus minor TaxID=1323400 RepID=A0ABQ9JDP6_9CUCU|nr:hypothetical protein NQ317_010269 [Molorchus minor]